MKMLVVYESMFGNTAQAARAVARGLVAEGCEVDVVEVGDAPASLPTDLALLVVGAPTHTFSLSRPATRADAVRSGAPEERAASGVREWLTALTVAHPARFAVFDTRVTKVRWIPKAAGPVAAKLGRRRGLTLAARPFNVLVDDLKGPLQDGALEAAEEWGRRLAADVRAAEAA